MVRYFRSISVILGFLLVSVSGCNKKCQGKDTGASSSIVNENELVNEIVELINVVCKEGGEDGKPVCRHTVSIPPGIFAEENLNVTIRYSDITLDSEKNDIKTDDGFVKISTSFSYSHLTVTVDDHEYKIDLNVTENHFDVTFTLKLPTEGETACFFEWNEINVNKFKFSTTTIGPAEKTQPIVELFTKDNLQTTLNSKPFLDYLNKESSVCNQESFLHDVVAIFVLQAAFKGLASALENVFTNQCF